MSKIKALLKIAFSRKNLVFTVLLALIIIQFLQTQAVSYQLNSLQNRESSFITEIGEMKEFYLQAGADINEIRGYLRLPLKTYSTSEITNAENQNNENINQNQLQMALFKYIENTARQKKVQGKINQNKEKLDQLANSPELQKSLSSKGLTLSATAENADEFFTSIIDEGAPILHLKVAKSDGEIKMETLTGEFPIQQANLAQEIQKYLTDNYQKLSTDLQKYWQLKDEITKIFATPEIIKITSARQITLDPKAQKGNLETKFAILNKSSQERGAILINHRNFTISLQNTDNKKQTLKNEKSLQNELPKFLNSLKTLGYIEQKVTDARNDLEKTFQDKGFNLLLQETGIKVSQPREDELRIYYDIFWNEQHLSSIVIEKSTGVVNITAPDGTNSQNLLLFEPETAAKKKNLAIPENIPEYDSAFQDEDGFNILIGGKHGSLVDTMIFAHINEKNGQVNMISIPRDLFYKGRKINAYGYFYGLPELKKVLGDLTGYRLDKYIVTDMYAFIDVINLIGGIDIHLDESVIDPSYKTVDDGVEGTLHYEPGDYHLNGTEALRLARSRKTTSDFARAERQQFILEAIQDKARNFGFGDAKTIYEIAKAVLSKTETDISLDEAISYFFRYQNYKIASHAVMSSGNVLYVPPYTAPEQCHAQEEAAAAAGQPEPACVNENQAYALLPRDNNWNIIKWFFRQEFDPS